MTINKSFFIALGFSVFWHLVWIVSITIVILPDSQFFKRSTDISFLGSFLSEIRLESTISTPSEGKMPIAKVNPSYMLESGQNILKNLVSAASVPQYQNLINEAAFFTTAKPFIRKIVPRYTFEKTRGAAFNKIENEDIEGEVNSRLLLVKPPFPKYHREAGSPEGTFEVDVFFSVTPQGEVYLTRVMRSSGNFSIDQLAVGYARQLRFSPLTLGQKQADQDGTITVTIAPWK